MEKGIRRLYLLFLLVFLVKFSETLWITHLLRCSVPEDQVIGLVSITGDIWSYITPVENLINTGSYFISSGEHTEVIGRMPYYGMVYFLARQFLEVEASYQAVVIFQIFMESVAVIMLSLLAFRLFKRRLAFYLTLILSLASLHLTFYANMLITESLSFSLLTLFCYQYILFLRGQDKRRLWYAAVFLGLLVSFKPYFGILFVVLGVQQLFVHFGKNGTGFKALARNALVLALPLLILLTPWTIRNYRLLGTFQPLYDFYGGIDYDEADMAYREFLASWGGSFVFWDKRSAGCYFEPADGLACEYTFPSYVLTESVTREALDEVRNIFIRHHADRGNDSLRQLAFHKFTRLTEAYRVEQPFIYYVGSHFIRIKNFMIHSGSYFLPISSSNPCYATWQLLPKVFTSLLYYACLVPGFLGLAWMSRRYTGAWLLLCIPLCLVLVLPVLVKATEWRYFMAAYPALLVGLVWVCIRAIDRFIPARWMDKLKKR